MYENKMNLINNLAKDLIYFFKSENNITLSKLKKYLSNNNNLNVNIDSLINLLESNGIIYYYDSYYGNVRILAGDRSYPFGTIVRVSFNEESFLGIVLDRGGAIGFNKAALFDLLYPSEYLANIDGVNYNTKFEILRIGF